MSTDAVHAALRRQHAAARERDSTVPPIGAPYWDASGGLVSVIGLRGVEDRLRVASNPVTEPVMLQIMLGDPSEDVRDAARRSLGSTTPGQSLAGQDTATVAQRKSWLQEGVAAKKRRDHTRAEVLLRRASDAGDLEARHQLGLMLVGLVGRGAEGFDCLESAAQAGHVESMYRLGQLYYRKQNDKSLMWLRRARDEGHKYARNLLGTYAYPIEAFPPEEQAAKRADLNKGACYIATAVYGSYDAPEVRVLRSFRDERLATSRVGRTFVAAYYAVGPPVADRLRGARRTNAAVRRILDIVVTRLSA